MGDLDLLNDWCYEGRLAKVNELIAKKDFGPLRSIGCVYADGLEVRRHPIKGLTTVATRDLPPQTLLMVELDIRPAVPGFLFPREPHEAPPFLAGVPFGLIPTSWYKRFPSLLSYLQMCLNISHGGLFGLGSMLSHSCSPNAERQTTHREDMSAVLTFHPIKKGEEITVRYTNLILIPDALGGGLITRLRLYWQRGFWCACERCNGREHQSILEAKMKAMHMVNTDEAVVDGQIRKAVSGEPKCGPYLDALGYPGKALDVCVDIWLLFQEMLMVILMPNGWGMWFVGIQLVLYMCAEWVLFGIYLCSHKEVWSKLSWVVYGIVGLTLYFQSGSQDIKQWTAPSPPHT
eukprot:gnl/MRDRNA2_/MRDRNA2_70663_c0_seq1.p1 gnl/MRDRNA2_/MRDRNA2_70663_c0~~gnl/MRDRNA2_/MRDRNA2_70663_c0_seq1.p1  ORF type:complete len:347 (+),score=31.36 gnl/MRDRNA2_/MRDRNA2_70663_c0_seq1:77-1117(+)